MEGYVKNVSRNWAYAMKRSVRPGGEIPLTELFEQYGKVHGMQPNEEFIDWLTNVKLKDKENWKIVYDFKQNSESKESIAKTTVEEVQESKDKPDYTTPMVKQKLEVADIVNLSVRKAREALPNIMDLNLLKYSLSEAKQLSDKDSLCRILHKRIQELQMSR